MPEYDNEMRGVLFPNRDKQPGDNKPNSKGECQINGVRMWLSAWTKTRNKPDGSPERYLSISFEVADAKYQPNPQRAATAQAPPTQTAPQPDPDEDIPF